MRKKLLDLTDIVALNRELMDLLDEVGTKAYEEKRKEEPDPTMPMGRVVFKTEEKEE